MRARALCLVLALLASPALAQKPATRESLALPTLAPLVESVKAVVVNVDVQARSAVPTAVEQFNNPFDFFGGGQRRQPQEPPLRQGKGSGTIIDGRGLVLTNNHVVEGAVAIRVRLDDGRAFDAEVVGRDPLTDVALIRLKGKLEQLPVARLGDSDAMRPGDWVVAIGNPFGLASSVSLGIISAKARQIGASQYDDFLQTDAAINPGNSGGPLFNMKGEVIGMNTAIIGQGTGIGFAVPSNLAKALLPQLESKGVVTRGWLGIGVQTLTLDLAKALGLSVREGAVVIQVNDGSPAKKAGLMADDVILAIDGQKISSSDALTRTVALKRPGSTSALTLLRGGQQRDVKVTLGTRPDVEGVGVGEDGSGGTPDEEERRQRLGLAVQDMDPRLASSAGLPHEGALIAEVTPGSPAERAELVRGMVVVEANRKPVRRAADLLKVLRAAKSGETLLLRVQLPSNGLVLRALTIP